MRTFVVRLCLTDPGFYGSFFLGSETNYKIAALKTKLFKCLFFLNTDQFFVKVLEKVNIESYPDWDPMYRIPFPGIFTRKYCL